jgi:hypothetical protein
MAQITIDLFEFQVLVEASWHAGTILRASIMKNAINGWYHKLSCEERARTFEFFQRTQEATLAIQKRFLARYDPSNQYNAHVNYNGEKQSIETYFFEGKYWTNETTHVAPEYILNVEKRVS